MSELENKYVRNKAKENLNSAVNHTKRVKKYYEKLGLREYN